jgi:ABC-type lipoprotein export system ATPase subunit
MDIHLSGIKVLIPNTDRVLFRIREFVVPHGEKVLIHGRSGIGKTTLLHLIAGLFLPLTGKVSIGGRDLTKLNETERCQLRRKYFGMLLQKLNLIDHLNGLENIRLGLFDIKASDKKAWDALRSVGMETFAVQPSGNLSLGEQQRLAMARVIAAKPAIVLLDEPTSSLDQENADLVMQALFALPAETTIIIVSHDQRIRSRFSRIYAFDNLVSE